VASGLHNFEGNRCKYESILEPTGRWKNSTIRDLIKIGRYFVDWVHLDRESD
jgi:hypothetical protein